ncbi:MAG: protein sorting system archaetidylserine synthase [Halanaeroarchaeum sp.]
MRPRFAGRLGLADHVTVTNAAVGFVAVVAAAIDPSIAARVILLGAILDAIDGIVARWRGGTQYGPHLDSLADVATFGVAPAFTVVAFGGALGSPSMPWWEHAAWIAIPAVFVATAVVRLGLYTALDVGNSSTEGAQTTLAATLIATGILAGLGPLAILAGTAVLSLAMLAPVTYPDLWVRDALVMGVVQGLAVLFPTALDRVFPTVLFAWALGYLLLSPRYYPRDEGKRS